MRLTHFAGALIFAAMLIQAGGDQPVSALTIPPQAPAEASQPEFDRFVAEMRAASERWAQGDKAAAPEDMARALAHYANVSRGLERPLTALEQDVLEIRNAVRDPKNFEAMGMSQGHPYRAAVVDPNIEVTLSNRSTGVVRIHRPLPNRPWTLYLDRERTERLTSLLSDPRNWQTPPENHASELWGQFLGVNTRHQIIGWSITAHPAVTSVTFLNSKRTRAEVKVLTSDFTGLVALLAKNNGQWGLVRVIQSWIA